MNDKPKSKWPLRLARWGMIALAVLATLAAVLVTEENWRGKRAWENYKRAAEARGERFDLVSVIPPPVPDEQNFFSAPVVTEAQTNSALFNIYRGKIANWITNGGSWQKGTVTDLAQWQSAFKRYGESAEAKTNGFPIAAQAQSPAADVLLALSVYDLPLEQFRRASLRPDAVLPLNYEQGFEGVQNLLPGLAAEKRWAQFLDLRISAELQAGQAQAALDDTKLFLRLIDSLRNQPFLISHLVRIAMTAIAVQPVYEGLAQQRWNDAQLAELQAALAREDFLADYELAMRGERVCAIEYVENQRITGKYESVEMVDGQAKKTVVNMRFVPACFFYQNELASARGMDEWVLPLVDLINRAVSPTKVAQTEMTVTNQLKHFSPYRILSVMTFPEVTRSVMRFANLQADVDLARVACALERFRTAHGNYPAALDELAPQFIASVPHDVIDGQPLHYRLTDDGKFVLYSIGWNEKDDGGTVIADKNGRVRWEQGDWVWKY